MAGQTVQYTPLQQSTPSDDEDDIVEYDRPKRPGPIQFTGLRSAAQSGLVGARTRRRKRRALMVAVLVAALLVVGAVASVVFAFLSHEFNTGLVHDVHFIPYGDWTLFFNGSASDSGVTLVDVDGDGLDDVLVGVTSMKLMEKPPVFPGMTVKEHCLKEGFHYPCISQVVALRGYDRKELWRTWIRYDLLFVNCEGIDVDGDGKADCIFSGRYSALQAVDLATGKIHWVTDADDVAWSSHFLSSWLVCRALSIPDVDRDGIQDILLTHGGDPDKEPEDHDRAAGRVIFLSGRSGKPLGRYLEMPNNRETYMSPVRYETANGSSFILLGSGGETVSGDLMIISFSDLSDYIMQNKTLQLGTLYRGREKGVMISPVLVDITGDGTLDILMSAFEGVVTLYDGETLQQVWSQQLSSPAASSLESYSVPAPGRFDDDDVPDFMMMWGSGRWPTYDFAIVYIISGSDGSVLWERRCQMVPMYSAVSLRTRGPHDLFLMRTIALAPQAPTGSSSPHDYAGARGTKHKHHMGAHRNKSDESRQYDGSLESFQQMCETSRQGYLEEHKTCSMDLRQWTAEVFVMDKAHSDSPLPVHSVIPRAYHYTMPVTERFRHCHQLSPIDSRLVDICIVMETKGLQGGIGDVDGDGEPDFIQAEFVEAEIIADDYGHDRLYGDIILSRVSLASTLKGTPELVPMKDQPWRQFMGSSRDSVYRVPQ